MVEVFKTNVDERSHADGLVRLLQQCFPGSRVNFDLEDCDKVLRVEGKNLFAVNVMTLVKERGYECDPLE